MRIGADFDLTSQLDNHLLEFGFGVEQHTIRGYGNFAYIIAGTDPSQPDYIRFAQNQPYVFGYDVTGNTKTNTDDPASLDWFADPSIGSHPTMAEFLRPRQPILGYLYLQDRFELQDLVLNLGVRMDYFDIKSHELIDPSLPYAKGLDPNKFDAPIRPANRLFVVHLCCLPSVPSVQGDVTAFTLDARPVTCPRR